MLSSQARDENRRVEVAKRVIAKAAFGHEAAKGNRRVLGDIGNNVRREPALTTTTTIVDTWKDRRITRAAAAKLRDGEPKENTRTITIGIPVGIPRNPLLPPKHPAAAEAVLSHKKKTLTALLTAQSQAAFVAEPLLNIDERDKGDPLAVVDYVDDIYSFYRKTESMYCVSPEYMSLQADINEQMRAIVVDWLVEAHSSFRLMPETLFLAINVLDRYLSKQEVSRKYLQLVGVTALFIASKYEEILPPSVTNLEEICDGSCTQAEILCMEKRMLNTLSFNLTVPTPYVFIVRYLKAASADQKLKRLAFYLVELCLKEYWVLKYRPSMLAASAVYTAQCLLKRSPLWSPVLQHHSGYSEAELSDCSSLMNSSYRDPTKGKLSAVYRKYHKSQ